MTSQNKKLLDEKKLRLEELEMEEEFLKVILAKLAAFEDEKNKEREVLTEKIRKVAAEINQQLHSNDGPEKEPGENPMVIEKEKPVNEDTPSQSNTSSVQPEMKIPVDSLLTMNSVNDDSSSNSTDSNNEEDLDNTDINLTPLPSYLFRN